MSRDAKPKKRPQRAGSDDEQFSRFVETAQALGADMPQEEFEAVLRKADLKAPQPQASEDGGASGKAKPSKEGR